MRLPADDSSSITLIAHTDFIGQTGKDIQTNAINLNKDLMQHMHDFEAEYMASAVPVCLQRSLHPYSTARKTELDKMVKKRHTVGDLLSKAANLLAFNESMVRNGFANIYQNINGYYGSNMDNTDITNMEHGTHS